MRLTAKTAVMIALLASVSPALPIAIVRGAFIIWIARNDATMLRICNGRMAGSH